jgi:hypothetical protein
MLSITGSRSEPTLGLLSAAVEQAPLDPVSGDALSFAFRRLAVGDLA